MTKVCFLESIFRSKMTKWIYKNKNWKEQKTLYSVLILIWNCNTNLQYRSNIIDYKLISWLGSKKEHVSN